MVYNTGIRRCCLRCTKLEDIMVEVSGVKMDVKSARVDPEIEFQVESAEKDVSAGVEERVKERTQENLSPKEKTD